LDRHHPGVPPRDAISLPGVTTARNQHGYLGGERTITAVASLMTNEA
jgi:hypothetical protein